MAVWKQWMNRDKVAVPEDSLAVAMNESSLTTQPTLPDEVANSQSGVHGTVCVRDGRLLVRSPEGTGYCATLWIPRDERLEVRIDGNVVVDHQLVAVNQIITVEFRDRRPDVRIEIRPSVDLLEVSIRVIRLSGERFFLADTEWSQTLVLQPEVAVEPPPYLQVAELRNRLHADGFIGDVDDDALRELCTTARTTERVVLRGRAASASTSGYYRQAYNDKHYDSFSRRMRTAVVPLGTTIATLEPGRPGADGVDIYGRNLPAIPQQTLPVLGNGVIDLNGRLVAARIGRLVFHPSRIDVIEQRVIDHDVTVEHSPLDVSGDLLIRGFVQAGARVRASGRVTVEGGVTNGQILAEDGIAVTGGVINGVLLAGQTKVFYQRIERLLEDAHRGLQGLETEYVALRERASQRPDGDRKIPLLMDALLEQRHPEIRLVLDRLSREFGSEYAPPECGQQSLVQLIADKWRSASRNYLTDEDVRELRRSIVAMRAAVQSLTRADPAPIHAGSVAASVLRATGNVYIIGAGAFSSTVECGDSLFVRGVVRGGFIVAERSVRIRELGSQNGSESSVRVQAHGGSIHIGLRHPNTLLEVAGRRARSTLTERTVWFRAQPGENRYDVVEGV